MYNGPFRWWVQSVMPVVFDDSLSYYEVLAKLTKYIEGLTGDVDQIEKILETIEGIEDVTQFTEMLESIKDEIGNLSNLSTQSKTDLVSAINEVALKASQAYVKPSGGIPESDLSERVQDKLNKTTSATEYIINNVKLKPSPSNNSPADLGLGTYSVPAGGIPWDTLSEDVQNRIESGSGGEGGTKDYTDLSNKPQINGQTLNAGNNTAESLGLGTYSKPIAGIPESDLSAEVQEKLNTSGGIADSETSFVATRDYEAGELIYINGVLYKTKYKILSGTNLIPGNNIETTDISAEIERINNDIDALQSGSGPDSWNLSTEVESNSPDQITNFFEYFNCIGGENYNFILYPIEPTTGYEISIYKRDGTMVSSFDNTTDPNFHNTQRFTFTPVDTGEYYCAIRRSRTSGRVIAHAKVTIEYTQSQGITELWNKVNEASQLEPRVESVETLVEQQQDKIDDLNSALEEQRQTFNILPQDKYFSEVHRGNPATINGREYNVKRNGEILVTGLNSASSSTYYIAASVELAGWDDFVIPAGTYKFFTATDVSSYAIVGARLSSQSTLTMRFTVDGNEYTFDEDTPLTIGINIPKNTVLPEDGVLIQPMIARIDTNYGYIAPWASMSNYMPNVIDHINNVKTTIDEEIEDLSGEIDNAKKDSYLAPYGLEPFQMSLFKQSANLFSDFCYHITTGYYRFRLDTTKNVPRITPTLNWQSWLIRVKPNTTYTIGPVDFKIELLTSECDLDVKIEELSDTDPNTITTGTKSYWLALTQRKERDMSNWMMVEGSTYPQEYISGYPKWVAEPLKPNETNVKTVAFMGDSITAGVATHKCYHQYIHDAFGYTCLNYGYGGAGWNWVSTSTDSGKIGLGVPGIGVNTTPETAFTPNNVAARLTELDPNTVDCIVIFAGTNDWHHNVTVADLITSIDSAFEYCKTNFTQIPVLVMTPIHRRYDTTPNTQNKTLREYADIIIEECKKYGIAYIDTMTVSELYPDNEANRIYYFNQNQESGLHPSSTGHKMIAIGVGEMIKQLMTYSDYSTP